MKKKTVYKVDLTKKEVKQEEQVLENNSYGIEDTDYDDGFDSEDYEETREVNLDIEKPEDLEKLKDTHVITSIKVNKK